MHERSSKLAPALTLVRPEVSVDTRVLQTIERMDEQLHRPISVATLAAIVGLSVSHLTRLFRAETGLTPGAFLHGRRMARARILLERTSLSVVEVMSQVGVADRSHFARDFKRAHGVTPRELRTSMRHAGL